MGSGDVFVSAWSGRLMMPPSDGENQWSPGGNFGIGADAAVELRLEADDGQKGGFVPES